MQPPQSVTFHAASSSTQRMDSGTTPSLQVGTAQGIADVVRSHTSFATKRLRDEEQIGSGGATATLSSHHLRDVTHSMLSSFATTTTAPSASSDMLQRHIVMKESHAVAILEPNPLGLVHFSILPKRPTLATSSTSQGTTPQTTKNVPSLVSSTGQTATSWDAVDCQSPLTTLVLSSMWSLKKALLATYCSYSACFQLLVTVFGTSSPQVLQFAELYRSLAKTRQRNAGAPLETMTIPFRVVAFLTPVCETYDVPALHVVSADAFYCRTVSPRWRSLMVKAKHAPDVLVEIGGLDPFATFLQRYTTSERPNVMKQVATRKRLQRSGDPIGCCLCSQTFESLEAATKHWEEVCLTKVMDMTKDGVPCVL